MADGFFSSSWRILQPYGCTELEKALEAVETAGFRLDPSQFAVYGEHMLAIAASEIANIPTNPVEAVQYEVLGTVLFEPVLTAIRRLGYQSLVKYGADS